MKINQASRARTTQEYALETLRDAILTAQLKPGARLVQSQVATELEISTTPVREALRVLSEEGLLHLDPHRGYVVRSLELRDAQEIYAMREALEPLLIPEAIIQLQEDDLDRAAQIIEAMEQTNDATEFVKLNSQFHGIFHEPAKGTRLGETVNTLRQAAMRYVLHSLQRDPQSTMRQGDHQHGLILDAYRKGDLNEATRLTVSHLQATVDLLAKQGP